MSLPHRTTVLIVGAGPSGLASAISLIKQGCRDIIVVDALLQGENTSRAMVIHAATLEALDTVQCAEPLIEPAFKASTMTIRERSSPILSVDFSTLAPYTRYPFGLLLPQDITERVLTTRLEGLGVKVFRPYKLIGMSTNAQNGDIVDVSFEGGQVIQASYVIGADGARSTVRQLAGISFVDPSGHTAEQNALSQMVLADVTFSSPISTALEGGARAVLSPGNFCAIAPLLADYNGFDKVYRLACGVPIASGPPPHAPPTAYLQDLLDKYGPIELSSDPSVNPNPVSISHTLWSTRFRTHSAAADRFFTRFGGDASAKAKCSSDVNRGAVIMLVGDAAHIHSPAGGQGMNLGLRDAVFLAPVIATHIKQCQSHPSPAAQSPDSDAILYKFASDRRSRALMVIGLTKGLLSAMGPPPSKWFWWSPISFVMVRNAVMRILGRFRFVQRMAAWKLSGLGAP